MATDQDKSPVWRLHNIEANYWDQYIATRPKYDERIFGPIEEYHGSTSTSWSAALDIGTGSGSALEPLARRFDHVVASDNDPTSLAFAKGRHSALPPGRVSYTLSSGEDLLQHFEPQSFDLITCAETFPLLDLQTALNNVFTLLRPGGTLALWFYGPPFFTEPEYAPTCQPILDALLDNKFRPVVNGGGEAAKASWKRAGDGKASWLDYVPFDPQWWNDVRRHKWNTTARLSFWTPDACDFPIEPISRVGDNETVTEEQDHSFWHVDWDFAMLKRFVTAAFPTPNDLVGHEDAMGKLFDQLAEAMGGEQVERKFSWPVVLVLARKAAE